ncbi:CRAL-TRIO domain-containing protein [Phakopsora pachyrhizi]|uniref:CRAL-TRIO domain-containing protein n=1 Tax=Phakopsora pachyrhizi TaxID=170000 RepID=A0AAV0AEZ0_PHAPC|nr:CRAL-TRIO domain-containing protein [Phakopsora pachyrhizi]CAH7666678.1 CRAL-TRIO domain-containing protein [Phakopsora pachyrhizi]
MSIKSASIESVKDLLTKPRPDTIPNLNELKPTVLDLDQSKILSSLIDHFDSIDFKLPTTLKDYVSKDLKSFNVSLTDWEKCSNLNRESLLRCLRADKWDLEKTKLRIEETLVWRRDCGCDGVDISEDSDSIRTEAETGKMFVLGFDKLARPIVHMRPRFQNTNVSPKRLQFSFWLIDRAIDLMLPGVESMLLIIDLAGPQESPSVKQQRDFVRSLGAHYCERLGQALVLNMPSVFVWILKLVKPFIDPVTFAKAIFDKADPLKYAPQEQLDSTLGGTNGYDFDIETYWPALMEECNRMRRERLERWKKLNKKIGSSEWNFETEKDHNDGLDEKKTENNISNKINGNNEEEEVESQPTNTRSENDNDD